MKGELTSKTQDLLGLKSWSVAVKYLQKRELNVSAFKLFNKRMILINKECMVFVCYPWMFQEFYLIIFLLF